MNLFNKISPQASAFILLFSFLGIYIINIACTIRNSIEWCEETHGNHCDDSKFGNNKTLHDDDCDGDCDGDGDEGCCSNVATIFFASVQSPVNQIEFNFTPIQFCVLCNFITIDYTSYSGANFFIKTRPPPVLLKFPDTRILIQSFQI